jgi:hypothetical protein
MTWLISTLLRMLKWVAILFFGLCALVGGVSFLAFKSAKNDIAAKQLAKPQEQQSVAKQPAAAKSPPRPSTDTAENRQKLVDALVAEFDPAPSGWGGFAVRKVEMKNVGQVSVTLNYSKKPTGYAQVQTDTKQVVRACLKWIESQGHDPAKEWITVTAWGHLPEKGETGKDLVRVMGRSIYDFNTDQINFKKDANLW